MKKVNGIVIEASEKELLEMFLLSNWHKTCTFDQFKDIMIDEGCKIIEEVEEQCDYQTNTSAQTVQSTTLEPEKIVQENVKSIETTKTVMATETNQQQTNSVNIVNKEMLATTKPQTESGVKKSTTTIDTEKNKQETQDKTTSTNTVLPSKKPVIIINKKKN